MEQLEHALISFLETFGIFFKVLYFCSFKLFHLFHCSIVLGTTFFMEQLGTGGTGCKKRRNRLQMCGLVHMCCAQTFASILVCGIFKTVVQKPMATC